MLSFQTHNYRRIAAVTSIAIAVGLIAAGCTPATSTANKPAPTTTAKPNTPAKYGDVVVKGAVTDYLGTYEQTTIDTGSPIYKALPSNFDSAQIAQGFSKADLLSAQQYALRFATEEATDGIAVDGTEGWDKWKLTRGDSFVGGPAAATILEPNSGCQRTCLINDNINGWMPNLIRDGKPRLSTNDVQVDLVATTFDQIALVEVDITTHTKYRITGPSAIASIVGSYGSTTAEVTAKYPDLSDGAEHVYDQIGTRKYFLTKDAHGWRIAGYDARFSGFGVVTKKQG